MRYLFIGAHADDIEIGCGGVLLKAFRKIKFLTILQLIQSIMMKMEN